LLIKQKAGFIRSQDGDKKLTKYSAHRRRYWEDKKLYLFCEFFGKSTEANIPLYQYP